VELTKEVAVGSGGRIVLTLPELSEGEIVDIRVVTREVKTKIIPQLGRLKGKMVIHDNFDDPIPGFEGYM
jgi:hypothetical protein